MKNPPSFQFYPQDFLSDLNVRSMNDAEVGMYIKLLCHCWIEDGLPVNGSSRVVDLYFKKSPTVAQCFVEKDGKYRNKRLDEEREKQHAWRDKCSKGGLHSVEKKKLIKGSSTKAQVKVNSSSSSSSSPSNKDHKNDLNKVGKSDPLFESLWKQWPEEGRFKKKHCRMKFEALCKQGQLAEFQRTTQGYSDYLRDKATKDNFNQQPMHLATWLNNWEGDKERYINYEYKPKM